LFSGPALPGRPWPKSGPLIRKGSFAAAARIREAGLIPGIWTSPFIAHESAGVWKKHPGWKLRGKDGDPESVPGKGIHEI
jgi:hypothetical protein